MLNLTIIRRSPIVLIRNFITIEIIALFIFFLASGHGDAKYELYNQLFFSKLLPYDTAKFLLLSGAQFCITIYAFLRWYYESYNISPGTISHLRGVLFRKKKTVQLDNSMTLTLSYGPLGKLFHYGSINLEKENRNSFALRTISRPKNYLKTIERSINPASAIFAEKPDIAQMISQPENEKVEFKSSLRFDHKIGQPNREVEKAAMKSIAAFLNSKGGYLVVGFDDNRRPLGIHHDYQTLQKKDCDGFENHFTQVFNSMIGPEFRQLVKVWFYDNDNLKTSVIQVVPSQKPVYLKFNDSERFYIRTGNIVTDLKLSEVEKYVRSRWPKYQG